MQQLNRINSPNPNIMQLPKPSTSGQSPQRLLPSPMRPTQPSASFADSGYHGSQSQSQDVFDPMSPVYRQNHMKSPTPVRENTPIRGTPTSHTQQSPTKTRLLQSPTATFTTAKEDQTTKVMPDATQRLTSPQITRTQNMKMDPPATPVQMSRSPSPKKSSPLKTSPVKTSPVKSQIQSPVSRKPVPVPVETEEKESESNDDERTHSDGSSPIRPLVRKSSLNFASLPAREPLNAGKSLGGRMSRTSNLGLNRTSYYGRATGGKSLGNVNAAADDDEMEIDDDVSTPQKDPESENVTAHSKSYTQRLQDQISMLGKSQPRPERLSRSFPNLAPTTPAPPPQSPEQHKMSSPVRPPTTPGAFPEDDEDDWIQPPTTSQPAPREEEPRPAVPPKDNPTDVAMSDATKEFVLPKQRPQSRPGSPQRPPAIPDRTTSVLSHKKSASVSALPDTRPRMDDGVSPKKAISVSNPTLASVSETGRPQTPKSPTRSLRESPLKHVKNKLSSILKSSKGLLASSAAISAEGKSSMLSPSTTRIELTRNPSSETVIQTQPTESVYPDLTQALIDAKTSRPPSPAKPNVRKTRASAERERREKQKDKETRMMEDQMQKLEKAREKEAEKARIFSQEQERIAALEKQIAAQKEQEKKRPATAKAPQQPVRSSPRRTKGQAQANDGDVDMQDATTTSMAPPPPPHSIPRPGTSQSVRKELKRPMRPGKETASKSRAAPTVIKVNMGPHQYHPSNSTLSANLGEALGPSTSKTPAGKATQPTLKSKSSAQSLKGSMSASGRPKALEMAAKRREQEEREAQRRRDAKAEMDRKRTAHQEEERRQEQQRRAEAEKKREREREAADAKKSAQRQAAIERAKLTRAPPPPVRSQPNGPPDYAAPASQEAPGSKSVGPSRPQSRMGSALFRSQDDGNRPVNALLSNANKGQKRPLGQENEGNTRPQQARSGPTYQGKDAKRRRTSQEPEDEGVSNINRPPVRPSAGYKKVRFTSGAQLEKWKLFLTRIAGHAEQAYVHERLRGGTTERHAGPLQIDSHLAAQQRHEGHSARHSAVL